MVSVDELCALFTGVPAERGWSTAPVYSVPLAFEIARRADVRAGWKLRELLYDDTSPNEIPFRALQAIQLAAQRYRVHRDLQAAGRGL